MKATTCNIQLKHIPTRPDWWLDDMQVQFDQLIRTGAHLQRVLMENGRLKGKRILTRAEVRRIE